MSYSLEVLPDRADIFAKHKDMWSECARCEIGKLAMQHVLGRGVIPCDVLFVGEAPGKTEDATGWPFCGRSGKLLDEWIADASVAAVKDHPVTTAFAAAVQKIGDLPIVFRYAITNTVCCRPCNFLRDPKNRAPSMQEKHNCRPRLQEFLAIAQPKLVITVGKHAAEAFHGVQVQDLEEITHPAAALYSGGRGSRTDLAMRAKLSRIITERIVSWLRQRQQSVA